MSVVGDVKARWEAEAAFFDRSMDSQSIQPVDPLVLRRYSSASPRRRFREEYRFLVLPDLRGKSVLDIGCGDGHNSVLLAKLGARATGIDISPKSIEMARYRASLNHVSASTKFICSPIESAEIPAPSFDVIWGDCILHHLIADLEATMRQLALWLKPGGTMLFSEPMNFNNTLRRLRLKIPIKTDATPDERPLEPREIDIVRRFLPDARLRFYSLLCRFDRFILLDQFNYEHSSWPRRATVNLLALIDYVALSLPVLRNMGGYAVIYGHAAQRPQ